MNSLALCQKMRTDYVCVCVWVCVCVRRYLINFFVSLWFACRKKKNQNEKKIRDPCVCLTRWQNKSCFHRNGSIEKLDGGELCVTSRTPPFRSVEPICQTRTHTHIHTRTQTTPDSNLRRVSTVGLESLRIFFQFDSVERVPPTANTGPANVKTRLSPNRVTLALHFSLCLWFSLLGLDANRFEHVAHWFRCCCCC